MALAGSVRTVEPFGDHPLQDLLSSRVVKCQPVVGNGFHDIDPAGRLEHIIQARTAADQRLSQQGPAPQVEQIVDDIGDGMRGGGSGHRLRVRGLLPLRERDGIGSTLWVGNDQLAVDNGFRRKQIGQHLHLRVPSRQVQQRTTPQANPATVDRGQRAYTVPGDIEGIFRGIKGRRRGHRKHRPESVGMHPLEGQVELNRLRTRRHASRNVLRLPRPCAAGPRAGPPTFWRLP